MSDAGTTSSLLPPASRRSVLAGAAWTLPALAASVVAPGAAASPAATTLAFDKTSYPGTACGTISGAYVVVRSGGNPQSGVSVSATLADGYIFSGGATTYTDVSGTDGRVALPTIAIPVSGGSSTLSATIGGSTSASATLSSPDVKLVGTSWNNMGYPALPPRVSATSVGGGSNGSDTLTYFLGNDGFVYRSTNAGAWAKVSPAGVTAFAASTTNGDAVYTTGTVVGAGGSAGTFPALPAGVTASSVGYGVSGSTANTYFLGSDGYLYRSTNGGSWTRVSPSGVTRFVVVNGGNGAVYSTSTSVGASWNNSFLPAFPAGVTPTGLSAGLAGAAPYVYVSGSDKFLYMSANGGAWTKVSPVGVRSFSATTTGGGALYTTGSAVGGSWNNNAFPALPAGVTALSVGGGDSPTDGYAYFLGSDGYLYRSQNAGAWTKVSPGNVASFAMTSTGGGAIFALTPGC